MKGGAINDYARALRIKEKYLGQTTRYGDLTYKRPCSKFSLFNLNFLDVLQTKFHNQITLSRPDIISHFCNKIPSVEL